MNGGWFFFCSVFLSPSLFLSFSLLHNSPSDQPPFADLLPATACFLRADHQRNRKVQLSTPGATGNHGIDEPSGTSERQQKRVILAAPMSACLSSNLQVPQPANYPLPSQKKVPQCGMARLTSAWMRMSTVVHGSTASPTPPPPPPPTNRSNGGGGGGGGGTMGRMVSCS